MKTLPDLAIKSKGLAEPMLVDYDYPENLAEGIKVDGEEKVYKLYAQQRKIRFMDGKRKEATGGGLNKKLAAALKTVPPEKLVELLAAAGIEVDLDGI